MIICKQQQIMKKMSKTKLTYITPVLDFVQAESEGLLLVDGSGTSEDIKSAEGWDEEAKDFYFQFDDSDADFFYLDWFSTKGPYKFEFRKGKRQQERGKKELQQFTITKYKQKAVEQTLLDYLDRFEEKARKALLKLCTDYHTLNGKLLESQDITDYWHSIEANYMADAVPQIAEYPTVSVAWATYLGMAVAKLWDEDWIENCNTKYEQFYGDQGFDNMDDHILQDILNLPLDSDEAKATVSMVQSLAYEAISLIRHEHIEPQSKMAFYAFSRMCNAMFSIGAAIQLQKLGYKFEKIQ